MVAVAETVGYKPSPTPHVGTPEPVAKKGNSARPEEFVEAISEQVKR